MFERDSDYLDYSFRGPLDLNSDDPVAQEIGEDIEILAPKRQLHTRDFYAYSPQHQYIFIPTGGFWTAIGVNSRLDPVTLTQKDGKPMLDKDKKPIMISATEWLDRNSAVEQITWMPGEPQLIKDKFLLEGGWVDKDGAACFNLYRAPIISRGNKNYIDTWVNHLKQIYSNDWNHIIMWMAYKAQNPGKKINHALVLGGLQGIGKDTILEPLRYAVGPWNFKETTPQSVQGRFNAFLKSVVLRVNEAKDLGESDRFSFYERLKIYIAAPPETLVVDEKNIREHTIPNVCGIIITTNYKTNGIYLTPDDRRHYVAWSDSTKEDFPPEYWIAFWKWYEDGAISNVVSFLKSMDLSGFNAKAPPPKTPAFWAIVDSNRSAEEGELADIFDLLGWPDVVTTEIIREKAKLDIPDGLAAWLDDRRNRRSIPHKLESVNYIPVRNPNASDGLWKIGKRRQVVYGKKKLDGMAALTAAEGLCRGQ